MRIKSLSKAVVVALALLAGGCDDVSLGTDFALNGPGTPGGTPTGATGASAPTGGSAPTGVSGAGGVAPGASAPTPPGGGSSGASSSGAGATTAPGTPGSGTSAPPAPTAGLCRDYARQSFMLAGAAGADFCAQYEATCRFGTDGVGVRFGFPGYASVEDCQTKYGAAPEATRTCRAGYLCQAGAQGTDGMGRIGYCGNAAGRSPCM